MKLYKISQTVNDNYDTYDSAVVCADNADEAKKMHPSGNDDRSRYYMQDWCEIKDVEIKYIGEAGADIKRGVIVASFNAG